jgi:hypothetical protein
MGVYWSVCVMMFPVKCTLEDSGPETTIPQSLQ